MKEKVGTTLANYIGAFMEYDKNNNSSFWRQYMRIRVKIDARMPLKKEAKVMDRDRKWCTVKFKYEKLGTFCFVCGVMGHAENKCEVRFSMEHDDGTREWSSEIRAETRRHGGRAASRWLKEENGGSMEQGEAPTNRQARGQGENSRTGPTVADVASAMGTNNRNTPGTNQGAIIMRQDHSLAFNPQQTPPAVPITQNLNSVTHVITDPIIPSQPTSAHTIIPTPPLLNSQFQIPLMPADNIITPFTNINSPIILPQSETEIHKPQSFTHQLLTFTSQASTPKTTRVSRGTSKSIPNNRPNPTSILNPTQARPRPEKKPKFVLAMNPTHTVPVSETASSHIEEMESQSEKKRRREEDRSNNTENSHEIEHFLTAGPGSQACRDQ
jgi:hypothetical protein